VLTAQTASQTAERVYREHGERIWRALFAYCGDRDVATDALSEAFAQLIRAGARIRDPVAWTWRAAFRIAAGELRERRRMTHEFEDEPVELGDGDLDLTRALARLSPRQRAALVLFHYGGYRVREIAAILESTSAAVKVHLSVGRKRLRRMLEDDSNG
jgi:RNA polymerase sigma-70 factor (ECF subfamily)